MGMPYDDGTIDEEAKKKEVVKNYLMGKWQNDNKAANKNIKTAQDQKSMLDIANIGGDIANQMGNSRKRDSIYYNGFNHLSDTPKIVAAEDNKYDSSVLSNLGKEGVASAQNAKKMLFDDVEKGQKVQGFDRTNRINERDDAFTGKKQAFGEWDMNHRMDRQPIKDSAEDSKNTYDSWTRKHTMDRQPMKDTAEDSKIAFDTASNKNKLERMPLENIQKDKEWKHKNVGNDYEDSGIDPNSQTSKNIRVLYQNVLLKKAAEAEKAKDKVGAASLRNMAKTNKMSAQETYDSLKLLPQMEWKDIIDSNDKASALALKAKQEKEKGPELALDKKKFVSDLSAKNANKFSIANQIDSDIQAFHNEKDPKQKVILGKNMLKTLNSLEGPDSLQGGEFSRLGSQLEFAFGNITNDNPFQLGRDLEGFEKFVRTKASSLRGSIDSNNSEIDKVMGRNSGPSAIGPTRPGAQHGAKKPSGGTGGRRRIKSIDDL